MMQPRSNVTERRKTGHNYPAEVEVLALSHAASPRQFSAYSKLDKNTNTNQ